MVCRLDSFNFQEDGLAASKIDVGRGQVMMRRSRQQTLWDRDDAFFSSDQTGGAAIIAARVFSIHPVAFIT